MAITTLTDVFSVVSFGIIQSFIFSTGTLTNLILQLPVSIVGGMGFGLLWGGICGYCPESRDSFVVNKSFHYKQNKQNADILDSSKNTSYPSRRNNLSLRQYYGRFWRCRTSCLCSSAICLRSRVEQTRMGSWREPSINQFQISLDHF